MENENKNINNEESKQETKPAIEKKEEPKKGKFFETLQKKLPQWCKTRKFMYAAIGGGVLIALIIVGVVIALNIDNGNPSNEEEGQETATTVPETTTVPEAPIGPAVLHYASEAYVTEETMKADIAKQLNIPEGTAFSVEGNFNLTKSGKYELTCKWDESEQSVLVCVYDNYSTVEINGKVYMNNNSAISMKYQKAVASDDFTKCITITDSIGNQLTVTKETRSMSFEDKAGQYLVFYTAVDGAGHQFNVRVLYNVTCEHQIEVEDGFAFTFEDSAKFSANFDGITAIWLEDGKGNRIDAEHYYMDGDALVLKKSYYGAFLGQKIAIKVCSEYSSDYFYATVGDEKKYDKYVYQYVVNSAEQSIICKKDGEELGYFAWPTVAKLEGDRLIAVSSGFRKAHIDTESKIAVWYSEDGGQTWSEPQVLVDTLLDDRDAGVVYWNGKIIVSWFCASKEYYIKYNASKYSAWAATIDDAYDTKYMGGNYIISEDGGETWSEIYSMPDGMFTPHGLIVNPEGGLTSVGYLKYDKAQRRWGTGIAVRTTTGEMDENGFIWSDAIVIADSDTQYSRDFHEPYGIYNDDGVLIVVMRSNKGLYQCELQPGETKFSAWKLFALVQETPAHMIQHSSGVMIMTYGYRGMYINTKGETVSYKDRNNDTTLGIRVRLSYDGGLTWTQEIPLSTGLKPTDDNTSDWGYTSSVELSDGKIVTVFYQRTKGETMASIYQIVWELPENIRVK